MIELRSDTPAGPTLVWLLSIPALGSAAIFCLDPVLPHDRFGFGASGFDLFNVWTILTGPVAVLVLLSLRRATVKAPQKAFLAIVNAGAVILSLCLLLVAAGV
jgi:hypothetical protein